MRLALVNLYMMIIDENLGVLVIGRKSKKKNGQIKKALRNDH